MCGHITYRVKKSHTDVLDYTIESHKLEYTERGDKSCTALPGKASKAVNYGPRCTKITNNYMIEKEAFQNFLNLAKDKV